VSEGFLAKVRGEAALDYFYKDDESKMFSLPALLEPYLSLDAAPAYFYIFYKVFDCF